MSRPRSSVPSQCAADGALRMAVKLVCSGSYGVTSGARMASSTKTSDQDGADHRALVAQEFLQAAAARASGRRGFGAESASRS